MSKKYVFLLFSLLETAVFAGLQFEYSSVDEKASPLDETFEFSFPFKNKGDNPLKITDIQPSCWCVKASAEKCTLKKGESSRINGSMDMAGVVGEVSRKIIVKADTGDVAELTVRVKVPAVLKMHPLLLFWNIGGDSIEKSMRITTNPEYVAAVEAVEPVGESFGKTHLERDCGEPSAYIVFVFPKSTGAECKAMFLVKVRMVDGSIRSHFFYCLVK